MRKTLWILIVTIFVLFMFKYSIMSHSNYRGPLSDHFDGERFYNMDPTPERHFGDMLKWRMTTKRKKWPDYVEFAPGPTPPDRVRGDHLRITFITHATVLIQTHGLNILTDPIFSERASPFSWIGPRRVRAPGIALDQLPPIDLVLISHNHYDHMDIPTLKKLNDKFHPKIFTGLGNTAYLKKFGLNAEDMDWWQSRSFKDVRVIFVPSRHFSARGFSDRRKTLWGGFVIEAGIEKIYFAGDTGYGRHFQLIREKLGSPTVALLPIGAYEPRWFMGPYHLNPDDAVKALLSLGAKQAIAIHFGTFHMTDEAMDDPEKDLHVALKKYSLDSSKFLVLPFGGSQEY